MDTMPVKSLGLVIQLGLCAGSGIIFSSPFYKQPEPIF
jgi:hypothetical protein